jgi:hypothetical protein
MFSSRSTSSLRSEDLLRGSLFLVSRRAVIRRLILAPVGVGLSLSALASLSGCGEEHSDKFKPLPGNRDDPKAQRDIEIPPGIPSSTEKSKTVKDR